jgi:hypothetical protein
MWTYEYKRAAPDSALQGYRLQFRAQSITVTFKSSTATLWSLKGEEDTLCSLKSEQGLSARGEASQDTMMNVQAAYMVCKDVDLVRHMLRMSMQDGSKEPR